MKCILLINFLTFFVATMTDMENIMSPNYRNESEGPIRALRSTQAYKDVTKSKTGNKILVICCFILVFDEFCIFLNIKLLL